MAMTSAHNFAVVLVTAPNLKAARVLAKAALQSGRAACVNLVPSVESHYWWQKKMEKSTEVLMVLKTARAHLAALEKCILAHHPYDTPEFIVLPLHSGNHRYLQWLFDHVR